MADRRAVRSGSRRKTPTPQPAPKLMSPQAARGTRARSLRSASREVEAIPHVPRKTTKHMRQSSTATESDHEEGEAPKTRRRSTKQTVEELTIVEEMDSEAAFDDAPRTPPQNAIEVDPMPFKSPGAASEMSGTTAITSFSQGDVEYLDANLVLKKLNKLHDSVSEMLEHLAPDSGKIEDDVKNLHALRDPDSEFSNDLQDLEIGLAAPLRHYKGDDSSYISLRSVHHTLFRTNDDEESTGLDSILYLANILLFAKSMVRVERDGEEAWTILRNLDNTFPDQFMQSLVNTKGPLQVGESRLIEITFALALDLRTQLAILCLERSVNDNGFNPDAELVEVFLNKGSSQVAAGSIRGWNIPALGGDSSLSSEFQDRVVQRMDEMRTFFPMDSQSLENDEIIDLDGLIQNLNWDTCIVRLLHWARLRHREITGSISDCGGIAGIMDSIRQEMANKVDRAVTKSPRKKRISLGRDKRRSSRKFDPNAPVDMRAIDALRAREQLPVEHTDTVDVDYAAEEPIVQEEAQPEYPDLQPEEEEPVYPDIQPDEEELEPLFVPETEEEVVVPVLSREAVLQPDLQTTSENPQIVESEPVGSSGPPKDPAEMIRLIRRSQKENRPQRLVDRQATAQRVEFGTGFDETQADPGPSSIQLGKRPVQQSPRKRARAVDISDDDEEDDFETQERTARVQERRQAAPVTKKVRIDASSSAPTSHQPPARLAPLLSTAPPSRRPLPPRLEDVERAAAREQAVREEQVRVPEVTEEAPPPSSTYHQQERLARENSSVFRVQNARKPKAEWTNEAEMEFVRLMSLFPARYSAILEHDKGGMKLLQERTQVNLKDKARTMATNMIKSGAGCLPGFEDIIKPTSALGKGLHAAGFRW